MESVQTTPFEYRCSRASSLVDVGATVKRLAAENACELTCLIPMFLSRLMAPRISVFALLGDDLNQSFSLDNGMGLQELLLFWLRLHKQRSKADDGTMGQLKKNKQFCTVWWDQRTTVRNEGVRCEGGTCGQNLDLAHGNEDTAGSIVSYHSGSSSPAQRRYT